MKNFRVLAASAALIALAGCSSGSPSVFKAGTYSGTAEGHNGDVTVEVTVSDTAITDVKVTSQGETAGIADQALNDLPGLIVKANSFEVDTISGCTDTSEAIINAVRAALDEAKK